MQRSRRDFLATALTAGAGASLVAVPAIARSPLDRIEAAKAELLAAMRDHYGVEIIVTDNKASPDRVRDGSIACIMLVARQNSQKG